MMYFLRFNEHSFCNSPPEDSVEPYSYQGDYGVSFTPLSLHRSEVTGWDVESVGDTLYGTDDIPAGTTAHVVVVNYQDGDTFGSRGHWKVVGVKRDSAEAERVVQRAEGPNDTAHAWRSWDGYFAHLNFAVAYSLVVSP